MPKVRKYDFQHLNDVTVATITECLMANGEDVKDIHKICGCSERTARARMADPGSFTLRELRSFNFTNRQIIQMFRGKVI